MAAPDRQAVDQIVRRRRSDSEAYHDSGLYPYHDLSSWTAGALALAPVGIAAAVESYVRDTIRELVDSGSPFVDRVDKLDLRTKPGIEAMKALHGRRISLGEWVSSLVRVSSVAHLDSHLSALFETTSLRALLEGIRYAREPSPSDFGVDWEGEPSGEETGSPAAEPPPVVVEDPKRVIASLGRLFGARHVAAHEANPPALDVATLAGWVRDARLFCDALDNLVETTLRPLEPVTTPMMELKASLDLDRASEELAARMDQLCARLEALPEPDGHHERHWSGLPKIQPAAFAALARRAQAACDAYHEAELDVQAYYWPDGTGWKTWRMTAELDLVEERSRRVAQSIDNAEQMLGADDSTA